MLRHPWLCAAALALALTAWSVEALYSKGDAVVQLTSKNFASEVLSADVPAVVEFYAPWCGHCKALAPQYKKVAENLQGLVVVGAVDCDAAANKRLCSQYSIQGFPTIKVFPADKQKNPYTGKFDKQPTDYQGPRSAKAIVDAAMAQLTDVHITKVKTVAKFDTFKTKTDLPKVVLFSNKRETTALYKALSMRYRSRAAFAEVRDSVKELVEQYDVDDFPALLVLPPGGAAPVRFQGSLKAAALQAFLEQHVPPAHGAAPSDGTEAEAGPEAGGGEEVEEEEAPRLVANLTLADLDDLAAKGDEDVWLVAFMQGNGTHDCTAEAAQLNKVALGTMGMTRWGQVNLTGVSWPEDAHYGVDRAALAAAPPCQPQLVLLPFGDKSDTDDWVPYTGALAAKELQAFAQEAFPTLATPLSSANADHFLALSLGSPLVLLFTSKSEAPAVFNALAGTLRKSKYVWATVHSSEEQLLKRFQVAKVPTLLVVFPDPEAAPDEKARMAVQAYPGPLKFGHMAGWLAQLAAHIGALPEEEEDDAEGASAAGGGVPGREVAVPQATTNAQLADLCLEQGGICVIALLDPEAPQHAEHLGMLGSLAARRHGQPLHWLWLAAPAQPTWLAGLGLAPDVAPAALALSPRKQRWALLPGAFSAAALDQQLDGLLAGKLATAPLQELPQLVDGGEEAGDAGEAEGAVEEEFDLADILAEEVEAAGSLSKEARLRRAEQELQQEEEARRLEQAAAAKAAQKRSKKGKKPKRHKKPASDEL